MTINIIKLYIIDRFLIFLGRNLLGLDKSEHDFLDDVQIVGVDVI